MGITTAASYGTVRGERRHVPSRRFATRRGQATPWATSIGWALVIASVVLAVGLMPTLRDAGPGRTTAAIEIRVGSTDTLWSIAASHRLPGQSTQQAVDAIREANGLRSATLQPGMALNVPTVGITDVALADASATR